MVFTMEITYLRQAAQLGTPGAGGPPDVPQKQVLIVSSILSDTGHCEYQILSFNPLCMSPNQIDIFIVSPGHTEQAPPPTPPNYLAVSLPLHHHFSELPAQHPLLKPLPTPLPQCPLPALPITLHSLPDTVWQGIFKNWVSRGLVKYPLSNTFLPPHSQGT